MSVRYSLVVGSVDEVSACFIECIQQFERSLLIHAPHELVPFIPNAHSTELKRRDVD